MVQQPQNTVALDDSYADESYEYGQYGDGGYDDGSGMIDPNTGMPMQGAGADGNKELEELVSEKIWQDRDESGKKIWVCAVCNYSQKLKKYGKTEMSLVKRSG